MKRLSLSALAAGHLIGDSYGSFLPALLPLLMVKHDLDLKAAGFMVAVLSFTTHFMQPAWGYLSDRRPGRQFAVAGPLVMAVCISSIGLAPTPALLAWALAVGGCGMGAFHPQATSLARVVSGPRGAFGISLFIAAGNLGFAFGPVVATSLVSAFGLPGTAVAVVPGLVVAVFLFLLVPTPEQARDSVKARVIEKPIGPLPLAPLVGLSVVSILRALVSVAFLSLLPVLFAERGLALPWGGALVTLFLLAGAVGGVMGASAAERYGKKPVMAVTLVLATPFLLLSIWTAGIYQALTLALGGGLLVASHPVNVSWGQSLAPHRSGTVSAITMGLAFGTAGLLMPLVGGLAETFGIERGLTVVAFSSLVAALLVLPIPTAVSGESSLHSAGGELGRARVRLDVGQSELGK